MIAVIQRVSHAQVSIDKTIVGQITEGFLVLLGIAHDDNAADIDYLTKKIIGLRVFADEDGKMNLDIKQSKGNILLVSQFTLHASTKKGNRPSFIEAARPEIAVPLYEQMKVALSKEMGKDIETGQFGADMQILLENDGPVTIIIDSKDKK